MIQRDRQPDLFDGAGTSPESPEPDLGGWARIDPATLDDNALIRALPDAGLLDAPALAAEASRRKLIAAVAALTALCHRFKGFGHVAPIPEQVAALQALAAIGGRDAAASVAQLIAEDAVVGPNLVEAVAAAATLESRLPTGPALTCLRHPDPAIRSNACRLVRPSAETAACLIDLLSDLHESVSAAAACALGRIGRQEARPQLLRLLANTPSSQAIDAFARIADDDDLVVLGRLAISHPELASAVLEALEESDLPRAATIAAGVRRRLPQWAGES